MNTQLSEWAKQQEKKRKKHLLVLGLVTILATVFICMSFLFEVTDLERAVILSLSSIILFLFFVLLFEWVRFAIIRLREARYVHRGGSSITQTAFLPVFEAREVGVLVPEGYRPQSLLKGSLTYTTEDLVWLPSKAHQKWGGSHITWRWSDIQTATLSRVRNVTPSGYLNLRTKSGQQIDFWIVGIKSLDKHLKSST